MKKLFNILAAVLLTAGVFAQAPEKMSYQAVIRNSSNALVISTVVGMKISILQGSATGTAVYTETQTPTTNANGLVSIEIGGGTGFSSIDWSTGSYFIKTETDPTGGTNYIITGTSQLLSVPYALHAKIAKNGISTTQANEIIANTAKIGVTLGTVSGQMQYWNGIAWVTIAPGLNGQLLKYKNGVPTWTDENINDLSIGDGYQGGIIAYFLVSGDPGYDANVRHGLITAPSDQSTGMQWYNGSNTTTGATAIGTGNANTNTIISSQGAGSYAAQLCADLVLGGYSDWYLPSEDELNKLYLNQTAIGGFSMGYYWSSTEASSLYAGVQYFEYGDLYSSSKSNTYYVRAIRAF